MRRVLALALLAGLAAAAPQPEVLREERYNYRVVGGLPRGWSRASDKLLFTYKVDGIPLAHVTFIRERVSGAVDVEAELKRRAPHYRFPGAPKQPKETIRTTRWADRPAFTYEHELTIGGVVCRRVVRALFDNGIWYEAIETLYGEPEPKAAAGLACFRGGFLLLTRRLSREEMESTAAKRIDDPVYGYRIEKPEGYVLQQPNPGADPGCRLVLLRRGPVAGQQLSIRLFEYGVRKKYDAIHWLKIFDDAFRRAHTQPRREPVETPAVAGSVQANGMRLYGRRDDRDVVTTVHLWRAESGRIFGLRIVSHGDAEKTHADSLKRLVASLAISGPGR